jgi:hypothetical protein
MRRPPVWLVLALVLLSGCSALGFQSGETPAPPSDQRALDALNRSQSALDDLESYRFSTEATVSVAADGESRTVAVDGDGAVNLTTRRMRSTFEFDDTGSSLRPGERTTYVVGDTVYAACGGPTGGWERRNVTADDWADATPLGRQLALLESTNVYWRGTETVNGTEAGVVVGYPSKEELATTSAATRDSVNWDRVTVQNATVRLYVDTDTGRPLKSVQRVDIEMRGASGTATFELAYWGFDRPVDVSVPGEVYDRVWHGGCPG